MLRLVRVWIPCVYGSRAFMELSGYVIYLTWSVLGLMIAITVALRSSSDTEATAVQRPVMGERMFNKRLLYMSENSKYQARLKHTGTRVTMRRLRLDLVSALNFVIQP